MVTIAVEVKRLEGSAEALLPLINEWKKESPGKEYGLRLDTPHFLVELQTMIDSDYGDVLVLVEGEEVIGMLGLFMQKSPLSSQVIAKEFAWYVLPKHRGISSLRLVKAAKLWAKLSKCSHLLLTASRVAGGMYDKVCKLFEKTGFTNLETAYITEV